MTTARVCGGARAPRLRANRGERNGRKCRRRPVRRLSSPCGPSHRRCARRRRGPMRPPLNTAPAAEGLVASGVQSGFRRWRRIRGTRAPRGASRRTFRRSPDGRAWHPISAPPRAFLSASRDRRVGECRVCGRSPNPEACRLTRPGAVLKTARARPLAHAGGARCEPRRRAGAASSDLVRGGAVERGLRRSR